MGTGEGQIIQPGIPSSTAKNRRSRSKRSDRARNQQITHDYERTTNLPKTKGGNLWAREPAQTRIAFFEVRAARGGRTPVDGEKTETTSSSSSTTAAFSEGVPRRWGPGRRSGVIPRGRTRGGRAGWGVRAFPPTPPEKKAAPCGVPQQTTRPAST